MELGIGILLRSSSYAAASMWKPELEKERGIYYGSERITTEE